MSSRNKPLATLTALGITVFGCAPVGSPEGTCYSDDHCPDDLICNDQGLCAVPQVFEEEVKLDVGTGQEPEIPTSCAEAMLVRTNAGCEFWAADLPNSWQPSAPYSHDIAAQQQFAVVVANVSTTDTASVTAHIGTESAAIVTVDVGPLQAKTIDLPARSVDPTSNGGGDAYRIVSDVPLTAYQFQPLDNLVPVYSNDASALLPSHVLENDYMAMTSHAIQLNQYPDGFEPVVSNAGAFVTVIAVENGTTVDFYPTSQLTEGAWQGATLNRGQQFTILSNVFDNEPGMLDPLGSLSGTRVIANKPVALFSGNVSVGEPYESTECCADHVEHQIPPLVAWGYRYAVAPPPDPTSVDSSDPAVYRVIASFDGTQLAYPAGRPDGAPQSLDAGQVATFQSSDSVAIVSDPEHPIAVGQFLFSSGAANPGGVAGDPAFIALPAVAQLQRRYVFVAPNGYRTHAVNVVAPQGAVVKIDGVEIESWTSMATIDGVEYVFGRAAIEPGAHAMTSDEPASLTVIGYDDYVSYAYTGGTAIRRVSNTPPVP